MSDIETEIAEEMGEDEAEAERDTLEHPEGEPVEGDATEASDVAPAPRSQAEIDELTKALEKQAAAHAKKIQSIMGEDFALLVPNPADWTPGYIFNVPEMHPSPEAVAEFHAILGQAQQIELMPATDAEACPDCNAIGDVLTGSRKPGQETKPCPACGGTGWKPKLALAPQNAQVQPIANAQVQAQPAPNTLQVADRWGRPVGHPHYGLEPAYVGG